MSTRMTPRKVQQTCPPAPTRVASELQEEASGVSPTTVAERTDVGRCCCPGWKGGQRPATAGRRTPEAEWANSANILVIFFSWSVLVLGRSISSTAISKALTLLCHGLWYLKNNEFWVPRLTIRRVIWISAFDTIFVNSTIILLSIETAMLSSFGC